MLQSSVVYFLRQLAELNWKVTSVSGYSVTHLDTVKRMNLHNKITMAGEVVPYYTVTALVPTLK